VGVVDLIMNLLEVVEAPICLLVPEVVVLEEMVEVQMEVLMVIMIN
jgi:hypothetical protein